MKNRGWFCWLAVWGAVLVCPLLTASCRREQAPKKYKLAFVTNNQSDFWEIARAGCQAAQADLGDVVVLFRMPDQATVEQQNGLLREVIDAGAQGVAVSPIDHARQGTVLNEAARRTLLITQDSDAPESDRRCYVGTDNEAAGRQAGELLKKALPKGGKVMAFVGQTEAPNASRRIKGLQEALAGSKVRLIGIQTDNTDRARAVQNVTDALDQHPDLAGVVGLWSYNGPAIVSALRAAGKTGQVQAVCFDEEDKTLDGVRKGEVFATIVQQPREFGYLSITLMHDILDGKPAPTEPVIVPTLVVDKSNVEEFRRQMARLRQGG